LPQAIPGAHNCGFSNYVHATQAVAILFRQNCGVCHQAWSEAEYTYLSPTGCHPHGIFSRFARQDSS
jgi:hypothetical protein